jgi:hypothetical protein
MDLKGAFHRPAPLTDLGEEALNYFASPTVHLFRAVKHTCVFVPRQRNATEHRHQRLLPLASCLLNNQGFEKMTTVFDHPLHATSDLTDLRLMLVGQGAKKGGLHHTIHSPQAVGIHGQPIVLDKASVFCLILFDDAEVIIDKPLRPVHSFACSHVRSTLCHHDVFWNLQTNRAVDTALPTAIMFVIRSERYHLEVKESGGSGPDMRDQRLFSRQFQSQSPKGEH